MGELKLTKESDFMICQLYKNYLEQRKAGISKIQAKHIGGSHQIHKSIFNKWLFEDVEETMLELNRAGLLHCISADNLVLDSFLTDSAIIYMENRFKNNVQSVLDYLGKIKSAIPFF